MPDSLHIIEERAFCGCKSISDLIIPENCQSIGNYAFLDCDSLYTVTINGEDTSFGIKSIGYEYDNGIDLISEMIKGDVNADDAFTIADVVLMQKLILASSDVKLTNAKAGDILQDNILNIFDLCMMKKMILNKI